MNVVGEGAALGWITVRYSIFHMSIRSGTPGVLDDEFCQMLPSVVPHPITLKGRLRDVGTDAQS